jgi:ABC-type polysaccharide transport system permease subunit
MKSNPNAQAAAASPLAQKQSQSKLRRFLVRCRKNWQLHLLMALPLIYILIFYYSPMYGLQIAFRDFRPRAGIWGSEWVGFKHFIKFFQAHNFSSLIINTLSVSLYQLAIGFPIPIILALMLHVSTRDKFKKVVQNVAYMPHFISTVVLVGIVNQILNPISGVYGTIYSMLGGIGHPADIRASADAFRHLYVWSGVWQQMGWSTIIYVAALAGVSSELHEAAELDGATRWQRVLNVDIPAILPTICIMLILRFGSVMSVGYEKVYLMQNDLNMSTAEVISTYVYKTGLGKMQMSYGTAIDLFNSIINTSMLLLVNWITDRLSHGEQGMF